MVIETKNGLKILKGQNGYQALFFDSSRIDDCIIYLYENNLKNISINPFQGYVINDLNFLSRLEHYLEGVTILDEKYDYAPVNNLHKLKSLGFPDNKRDTIDLSNFPHLESLACDYSPRLKELETCGELRSLTLSGYKSSAKTIEKIPPLPSLITLNLFVTNITSLVGINSFPQLNELTLFRASRLEDISALREIRDTVTRIEIDSCKQIRNYEVLGELTNLERLIISCSSPIESLSFTKTLPNLDFLSFVKTNIVDGDLSPTLGMGYVGFENKRHYSHKFEEISGHGSK